MLCVDSLSAATSQAQRYAIVGPGTFKVNTLEDDGDSKSSELRP
jgi:hypothetical protein